MIKFYGLIVFNLNIVVVYSVLFYFLNELVYKQNFEFIIKNFRFDDDEERIDG